MKNLKPKMNKPNPGLPAASLCERPFGYSQAELWSQYVQWSVSQRMLHFPCHSPSCAQTALCLPKLTKQKNTTIHWYLLLLHFIRTVLHLKNRAWARRRCPGADLTTPLEGHRKDGTECLPVFSASVLIMR